MDREVVSTRCSLNGPMGNFTLKDNLRGHQSTEIVSRRIEERLGEGADEYLIIQ